MTVWKILDLIRQALDDVHPEDLIEAGGAVDRVSVSLRVFGDDVDPDEITRLLGCEPTSALRKGDVVPDGRYRRTASTGSWHLNGIRPANEELEAQVLSPLGRVTADERVWRDLAGRCVVDLFCGVFLDDWNRGFALSPLVLSELARRELTIEFDIYANDPDSEGVV